MKNYCLLLLLLGAFFSANAQKKKQTKEIPLGKNYIELGLNLTGAIQTFVHNRTDSVYSDPYALTFKYIKGKGALRLGFGYSFNSTKNITLVQARIEGLNRLDTRVGLEYQYPIGDRWRLYAGADVLYGTVKGTGQYNEGDLGKTVIVDVSETTLGGGPVLGVQFHLNRRISFLTEAAFYGMHQKEQKTYRNTGAIETRNAYIFPPGVPRSITVVARF